MHEIAQRHGEKVLNKTANVENISGRAEQFIIGPVSRTWLARNITPLHYAYMIGREDAFRVLLAEGADIDGEIFFQTTSMNPEPNEESKTTSNLLNLMLKFNQGGVSDVFRSQEVRNAFFIALIQRNKLLDVLKIMFRGLEANHKYKSEIAGFKTRSYDVDRAFEFVPSIKVMKDALGVMDASYQKILDSLVDALRKAKHDAESKQGLFVTYEDEAVKTVLDPINQLIDLFSELRRSIDHDLSHESYLENTLMKLLGQDRNFDRENKKKEYMSSIRTKLNHALYWIDKDDDDLEDNPAELLRLIVSMSAGMVKEVDEDLYRETVLDFVKNQISGYAKSFNDIGLQEQADRLARIELPVSAEKLKQELVSAEKVVRNFWVEPKRSGPSM